MRRTIELEKTRGQSHRRGQHPFTIRSGAGSTTGKTANPDDPRLGLATSDVETQSYVHVFPSLHMLSRGIMEERREPKTDPPTDRFAAFGVTYLDEMLEGQGPAEGPTTHNPANGSDNRGLPWSSITALIGDAGTQKTPLGYAFLARCFVGYARRLYKQAKEGFTSEKVSRSLTLRQLGDDLCSIDKSELEAIATQGGTLATLQSSLRELGDIGRVLSDVESSDGFCRGLAHAFIASMASPTLADGDGVPVLRPQLTYTTRNLPPSSFHGSSKRSQGSVS